MNKTRSDQAKMGARAWFLWVLAFILIASLTVTVFTLYISLQRAKTASVFETYHVYNLSVSLGGLMGLFILYTVWKQKQINRMRTQLYLEEQQLHALRARFDEVIDLFRAASSHEGSLSLPSMLDIVAHRCVDALHAQQASVMLVEDGERLLTKASYGVGHEFAETGQRERGEGVAGRVLENKQPVLLPDDDRVGASAHPHRKITSAMSVPICVDDVCVGVLNVNRINHPIPFSRGQLEILTLFATHVGTMLRTVSDVDRLRARSKELEQETIRLEEFGKIKDIFLSTASHELKTPLTAVIGYAELLGDERIEDQAQKTGFLKSLQAEATRLLGLIENILDFTRLETGKTHLNLSPTSLTYLLHSAVDTLTPIAKKHGLVIEEQYPVEDVSLNVDEVQLRQVFINLLTNAVRYSPSGETIRVAVTAGDDEAIISVSDHGPGIMASEHAHIFKIFGQGLQNHTGKGLGIGLYLVQRIVELHGGTVELDSSVESGSSGCTFSVHLPLDVGHTGHREAA